MALTKEQIISALNKIDSMTSYDLLNEGQKSKIAIYTHKEHSLRLAINVYLNKSEKNRFLLVTQAYQIEPFYEIISKINGLEAGQVKRDNTLYLNYATVNEHNKIGTTGYSLAVHSEDAIVKLITLLSDWLNVSDSKTVFVDKVENSDTLHDFYTRTIKSQNE
ncbi:TPA: hypothetical protein ACJI3N_005314 [Raoultella planticola]